MHDLTGLIAVEEGVIHSDTHDLWQQKPIGRLLISDVSHSLVDVFY